MDCQELHIAEIARQVRDCIETIDPVCLPSSMMNFPRGACGDSALLMGALLADRGYTGFEYICGNRGNVATKTWTSHAWLRCGSLIVDITADQFDDAPAPIIVSNNSVWHQSFDIDDEPGSADFRDYSGPGSAQLLPIYTAICDAMNR